MVIPSWKGMQESSQQMKTVLEPTIKDKKDELAAVQRKVMWDLSGKQWYRLLAALFSYSRGSRGELHVRCNYNWDGFSLSIWRRSEEDDSNFSWSHTDNFKAVVVRLEPLKKVIIVFLWRKCLLPKLFFNHCLFFTVIRNQCTWCNINNSWGNFKNLALQRLRVHMFVSDFLKCWSYFFLRTVEKHNGKVLNRHGRHDERDCRTS